MIRTLVLFLCITNVPSIKAQELLISHIKNFNSVAKKAGSVDASKTCNGSSEINDQTYNLYSPLNKKNIELSIVTEARAKEVFKLLASDEDNSFIYPIEGCFARAHKMAQVMDELGITSGKAFVTGEFNNDKIKMGDDFWRYHVASVVMVKKNGVVTPTIMDPALFDKPVSVEEWKKALLQKKGSKLETEYFTKRFVYDYKDRDADINSYWDEDLESMKQQLRDFSRRAEMEEFLKKDKKK